MAQAAEAAVRQGLNELCITDHVDTLYWDDFRPRWDFDWDEARRQFREAQALWGDRITLRLYRRLGGEIVTLGSDAHRPGDVGCFIRQRQELLRECGFRYFTTFEQGKPRFQAL